MKPLVTCERVLTWLNVYGSDKWTDKIRKMEYILFTFVMIATIISATAVTVGYIVKFKMNNMSEFLYATLQVLAFASMMNLIIAGFLSRQKIMNIFDSLSHFHNTSKIQFIQISNSMNWFCKNCNNWWNIDLYTKIDATDAYSSLLVNTNDKSERAWATFFKMLKIILQSFAILSITSVVLCWIQRGKLDTEYFFHPARF